MITCSSCLYSSFIVEDGVVRYFCNRKKKSFKLGHFCKKQFVPVEVKNDALSDMEEFEDE